MEGGAANKHVEAGNPSVVNGESLIGSEPLRVRTSLCKPQIRALVLLPLATIVLERRNRQHREENQAGHRKDQARAVAHLAHVFSRHASSTATPTTSLVHGRMCPRP